MNRREQILKRNPLRDELVLVQGVPFYPPVKTRRAHCFSDVPAIALGAGGFVYYPPAGGARVLDCLVTGDNGAPGTWRFGLRTIADIALSAQAGGQRIIPEWPDAPLLGQFESFQLFSVGDMSGAVAAGIPVYPDLLVMPGNIFVAALTGANAIAEGYLHVEEFFAGDEML